MHAILEIRRDQNIRYLHDLYYYWVDTSAGENISPRGYHPHNIPCFSKEMIYGIQSNLYAKIIWF